MRSRVRPPIKRNKERKDQEIRESKSVFGVRIGCGCGGVCVCGWVGVCGFVWGFLGCKKPILINNDY